MRSRQTTTTYQSKNRIEKLILVRESVFYGLEIENKKQDKTSINRGIVSTPNIVFYSNNTKCLIDYTNQINKEIEGKINEYFLQIPAGATLNLYNAFYSDVNSKKNADLSGTYKFRSYFNGIIEADVISVESLSSEINRYDKKRFENIPFIITQSLSDGPLNTIIKNKFGKNTKNSFNYLGAKVGDLIKITDIPNPLAILEISTDADGNEYVVIDGILDPIDLTNSKTKVQLYILVSDEINFQPAPNDSDVGSCTESSNGIIISCTNNHTVLQCVLRTNKDKNITTSFAVDTFCATTESQQAVQKDTTESLVQLSTALANIAAANISNVSGPVLKNSNSKNSFYGRPF